VPQRHAITLLAVAVAFMLSPAAIAQDSHEAHAPPEQESRKGHGEFTLYAQYVKVDGFAGSLGDVPVGEVETQVLGFRLDYFVTDRLALVAGLPYVRERYLGPFDHDPLALDPPRTDVPNIDLGDWNTDFQDWMLGARYILIESPLVIQPFIFAGVPSTDYPFYGHAAIGRNRKQIEVGSTFAWRPLFSDWWFRVALGYTFVEQTLGVSVNHFDVVGEVGYFLSPRVDGRVFIMYREGDGLNFPTDFAPPAERTDEMWYQHDRLVKHNFTNAGIGFDWALSEKYGLSTTVLTMLRATQIHDVEYSINVALTRLF
jgi:hypothetical protein